MEGKINFKPEQRAKIIVSTWLLENGYDVFWEQKPPVNLPFSAFRTTGISKKPDLFFRYKLNKAFCGFIEMKVGSSNEIGDATKIIDYYKNYAEKRTTYYLNETDEKIEPKLFVVGSEYSPEGHLFEKETLLEHKHETLEENVRNKRYPRAEFQQTKSYFRHTIGYLWKNIENKDPSISMGVLLSTKLNDVNTSRPLFFVWSKKNTWRHEFFDF